MSLVRLVALLFALAPLGSAAVAQTQAQKTDRYFADGRAALDQALRLRPNTGRAKNVILFLGDGMGISTVTAGRIFEGQSRGVDGESNVLAFETLPYAALSKTYSVDYQVTDSAAGIDAIVTGVKTRSGVIGLGPAASLKDCATAPAAVVTNIAELAKASGRSTGAVTTTRLTHATPAGVYAHTPYRDWEADSDMEAGEGAGCIDIARQLIEAPAGRRLNLALGGGRDRFLPKSAGGKRSDGRDLTAEWARAQGSAYVSTAVELEAARPGRAEHLLGLFAADHLPYEADRAKAGYGVPTLSQMTAKAIDLLSANRKGYFLLVEGGRIDHASHANNAYRTLSETAEFANAVRTALSKVDLRDTLVVVTADHSLGLVISGYPPRNNPILGLAAAPEEPAPSDGKAYTTLSFATGPGAARDGVRRDPAHEDTASPNYRQSALVPAGSGAHSGEDVPVYAGGPHAHLLHGVVEESYIFQVMSHAMGLDRAGRRRR